MEYIENKSSKYCSKNVVDGIKSNYTKIVGIESNLDIMNENDKCVGRIILILNSKKLFLDEIVQFNKTKVKWSSSNFSDDGFGFYLVDPYWVKSYAPLPKINVPVYVYDPKSEQFVINMVELNYNQFQKRKLMEFYRNWKYVMVAAYDNFNYLLKNNAYYFAINATVKNYGISQKSLTTLIGVINNEKKKIKAEWNKHLNNYFQQNESSKLIEELYGKSVRENVASNVISFKK